MIVFKLHKEYLYIFVMGNNKTKTMKFNLLSFILGGLCFLAIGAGAVSSDILTVKPAVPKQSFCKKMYWESVPGYVNYHVQKGYSVKIYGAGVSNGFWIVVLEKY